MNNPPGPEPFFYLGAGIALIIIIFGMSAAYVVARALS
jgi:hypothetical protein